MVELRAYLAALWLHLKAARGNMAEKPAPLPTVSVHVGHGNVGEPHNGCHDGPARCTAIGGIRWSKFPYMCLHASNRLLSELLAVCVCACSEQGLEDEIFAMSVRST